jgi:hypothetical protein
MSWVEVVGRALDVIGKLLNNEPVRGKRPPIKPITDDELRKPKP